MKIRPKPKNQSLKSSVQQLRDESLKSRYKIMSSYLQFLFSRHVNLELEIILSLFQGKERSYHDFIAGILDPKSAEPICKDVSAFLRQQGYPVSFMEHKVARVSK